MTGNDVRWVWSFAFKQRTSNTSNTTLFVHIPTPLGCFRCLKRGQKTRSGTFVSVSPVPWSVFGMDFWGRDEKHGHHMPIIDVFGQAHKQEKRCRPVTGNQLE